jgi:hypothetical protein
MATDVTKRLWEIGDIVDVLEAWETAKNLKIMLDSWTGSQQARHSFHSKCYGVNNGAIQMELAANTIMPEGIGTKTDVLSCHGTLGIDYQDAGNGRHGTES